MRLKASDRAVCARIAAVLRDRLDNGEFEAHFGLDVTLVPAPGHAPQESAEQQSATRTLVDAMQRTGLGVVHAWLHRERKVHKAAWAPKGGRPTYRTHLETIRVVEAPGLGLGPDRITIVDDVVTTGATLLACASLLRKIHPQAAIVAFAAVRTMSGVLQVESLVDPIQDGVIRMAENDRTRREP